MASGADFASSLHRPFSLGVWHNVAILVRCVEVVCGTMSLGYVVPLPVLYWRHDTVPHAVFFAAVLTLFTMKNRAVTTRGAIYYETVFVSSVG